MDSFWGILFKLSRENLFKNVILVLIIIPYYHLLIDLVVKEYFVKHLRIVNQRDEKTEDFI